MLTQVRAAAEALPTLGTLVGFLSHLLNPNGTVPTHGWVWLVPSKNNLADVGSITVLTLPDFHPTGSYHSPPLSKRCLHLTFCLQLLLAVLSLIGALEGIFRELSGGEQMQFSSHRTSLMKLALLSVTHGPVTCWSEHRN